MEDVDACELARTIDATITRAWRPSRHAIRRVVQIRGRGAMKAIEMSGAGLAEALQQPVSLELSGAGRGAWVLKRGSEGTMFVEPITGDTRRARGAIRSATAAFMLWGTHRVNWRESEIDVEGDGTTEAVLDALHVY